MPPDMAESELPPPTGTVTFLFTDIEGSTQQWEQRPQAMAMALRRHDDLVRATVSVRGGHVFATGGDGFGVAFSTARDAVEAAVEIQRELSLRAAEYETAIKVRMGLHAGTAEERGGDYFGPVLNRAARIMAAAHGGQILISGLAAELWDPGADPTIELQDLGTHRLKDLLTPERILQVVASDIPGQFPPLRSRRAGNLPRSSSTVVGREAEVDRVIEALSTDRLVCVVGAVQHSASTICLVAARSADHRFPQGAWHVDLAALDRGSELAPALATALGVAGATDAPAMALDDVAEALHGQPTLLVLEGGTLGGELAPAVADLVERLPAVSVLVAAPSPLGLTGERVVEVRRRRLPPDLERYRAGPFVGRTPELARLRREVDEAASGARRLVVVSGEEGMGKSRLLAELAAEVVADDGLVLHGTWDEERVTDFQAFRQAFARHADDVDRATRPARFGDLLPMFDALLPGGATDAERGNDVDPYRLLDALDSWLAQLAANQPVLLWLDDLQWADPSSLQMLQHLARSPRAAALVIAVTYQPAVMTRADDASHALAQLRRSPGYEDIELGGLDIEVATAFAARSGFAIPSPRSLLLMHEWSGGNPYFLHELLRMVEEPAPGSPIGGRQTVAELQALGAPQSISDVVHWRLARRSPRLTEVLTAAAVIGSTFDTPTLAAVVDADLDEVEDLMDEAVLSGLVDDVPGSETLFTFRQDLVRQALYQDLRPRQRTRLHRRVLDVLLAGPDPDPGAVSRHLSIAAGPDDLDRTVEYATSAARRAADQLAFENAARHYDEALSVLDRHPEADGPRIELLLEAGRAHNRAGALGAGRDHLRRAAIEARRRDRPDLMAEAALAWGGALPAAPPTDPEAVELLEVVAAEAGPDSAERAMVDEAVAIAERLGDPGVLGRVLVSAMSATHGPDETDLAAIVAERVIALSQEAGDDELAFEGWKLLLHGQFAGERIDEARAIAATVRRLGEHLGEPEYLRIALMWDANLATLEGRFDDARTRIRQTLTVTLTGDHSQVSDIQLLLRVPRFGLQGMSPKVRATLDGAGIDDLRPFLAWFHAEADRPDLAAPLLEVPGLVEGIADARGYLFWGDVACYSAAAALVGDRERATQLRDLIAPYRAENAVLGLAAFLGSAAHHCGVLNGVLGEWDDAVVDLEAGLERHRSMGARPWTALTQIELARVLEARRGPADAARAAELRAAALAVADELDLASVRLRAGRPLSTTSG